MKKASYALLAVLTIRHVCKEEDFVGTDFNLLCYLLVTSRVLFVSNCCVKEICKKLKKNPRDPSSTTQEMLPSNIYSIWMTK